MSARPVRIAVALVASAAMLGCAGGAALAASPSPSPAPSASPATGDAGLFGVQDPTYDGVYRQSLAILGLVATGQTPDASAVGWLLGQQCADGAFTAYRADPGVACTAAQEDENATAMAIQALAALGKPLDSAVAALKRFQLADGGFYDSTAFGPPASDANSTGLALSAFAVAGVSPATTISGGKTADDYLRSIQLSCAAPGGGAFDFQAEPTLAANDYATVQALLGQLGTALPVSPGTVAASVAACATPTDAASSADAAVSYLAARLTATSGAIPSAFGADTDWTSTANALLDLVAAGHGSDAVTATLTALETNAATYAKVGGSYAPGPLGTLLLVAHATGVDPASFGGVDLVTALTGAERTAAASPAPTATTPATANPTAAAPTANPTATLPFTGSDGLVPLGALGTAMLALGFVALAVSRRRSGGETS